MCKMGNCSPIFRGTVHPDCSVKIEETPLLLSKHRDQQSTDVSEHNLAVVSRVSSLTMDEDFRLLSCRSFNARASYLLSIDSDQEEYLNPFTKSLIPLQSPLQSPASQGETFFDEEEFESEKELSTMTKQVIESCLQVLSDPSPKMSLLLAQVNRIELEREEAKRRAFSPRTAFHKSIRRQEVLQDIREEARLALVVQDDE